MDFIDVLKDNPDIGIRAFYTMGWSFDQFGMINLLEIAARNGLCSPDDPVPLDCDPNDPVSRAATNHKKMAICIGLTAAICHEAHEYSIYDMSDKLVNNDIEIMVHAIVHPHDGICTVINYEQGWKLITTSERANAIIAGYLFVNKTMEGINRVDLYENNSVPEGRHVHIVIYNDVALSPVTVPYIDFMFDSDIDEDGDNKGLSLNNIQTVNGGGSVIELDPSHKKGQDVENLDNNSNDNVEIVKSVTVFNDPGKVNLDGMYEIRIDPDDPICGLMKIRPESGKNDSEDGDGDDNGAVSSSATIFDKFINTLNLDAF